MKEASIIPEELSIEAEEEEEMEESEASAGGRVPPDEERLSIFEDYLSKKGAGSQKDKKDEEDEEDNEDEDK